jgi:hypothetical protein
LDLNEIELHEKSEQNLPFEIGASNKDILEG